MRKRFWLTLMLFGGAAIVLACDSFDTSSDTPSTDAGSESDASTADDQATPDAPLDGPARSDANAPFDAGPGAVFSDSFEDGLNCTSWDPLKADQKHSDIARSGSSSCRICMPQDTAVSIFQDLTMGFLPGTYQVEAWVRTAPDAAAATAYVSYVVYLPDGGEDVRAASGKTVTDAWEQSAIGAKYFEAPVKVRVYVHSTSAQPGACYLVDDVVLRHIPL